MNQQTERKYWEGKYELSLVIATKKLKDDHPGTIKIGSQMYHIIGYGDQKVKDRFWDALLSRTISEVKGKLAEKDQYSRQIAVEANETSGIRPILF